MAAKKYKRLRVIRWKPWPNGSGGYSSQIQVLAEDKHGDDDEIAMIECNCHNSKTAAGLAIYLKPFIKQFYASQNKADRNQR
jgi:hypothetical protein